MIGMVHGMIDLMNTLLAAGPLLVRDTDSEGGTSWLLLSGPVAGAGLYWALYRYYRNTDKSHQFEQDTEIVAQPVTGVDSQLDLVLGTKRSSIEGSNVSSHRDRVQRVQ